MDYYLGIDGGGSKTRALLLDEKGEQLFYAESGPCNLNAYEEPAVIAALSEVVEQCTDAAGKPPTATCLGLAGAGNPVTKSKLESILRPLPLGRTRITTDAEIALEGAYLGGPGILLIAGTGSICLGKSADGTIQRTGGWGWLADDGGSAAWIGQRALEIAVRQNDGRLEGKALGHAVFESLGIRENDDIAARLYQPEIDRSKLAELAKCVIVLAENNDAPSRQICHEAVVELEQLVRATAGKLKPENHKLVLAGGLLSHHPFLVQALETRLAGFPIQAPQASPVEGAAHFARKI